MIHSSSNRLCNSSSMSTRSIAPSVKVDFDVDKLQNAHWSEVDKFNKFDEEKLVEHYDDISVNYDGVYKRMGYPDPEKVAENLLNVHRKTGKDKDSVQIVDFCCGTGLVGESLGQRGFKNVTGLDVSQGMLSVAREKLVYKELEEIRLSKDDPYVNFPKHLRNHFDYAVGAGFLLSNYVNENILEEMLCSLKPGGYLIVAARFSFLGPYWYVDALTELEKSGEIELISEEKHFKYDQLLEGYGKFSKTPVKTYVYQKTHKQQGVKKRNLKRKSTMELVADA